MLQPFKLAPRATEPYFPQQFQQPTPERWFADALVCTSCSLSAALLLLALFTVHCCRHALDPLGLASAGAFVVVFLSFAFAAGVDSPEVRRKMFDH